MRCRFEDSNWNDYWAAVLLSNNWTDEQMGAEGVNFETMSGTELLTIMESLLRRGVKKPLIQNEDNPLSFSPVLVAFLGSRGIITSRLTSSEDYWTCAKALWPKLTGRKSDRLDVLEQKIKAMSKSARGQADLNLYKVKSEWRVR